MFGFLKDKLKSAIKIFSKKVEDEADDGEPIKEVPKKPDKKVTKAPIKKETKPAPKEEPKKQEIKKTNSQNSKQISSKSKKQEPTSSKSKPSTPQKKKSKKEIVEELERKEIDLVEESSEIIKEEEELENKFAKKKRDNPEDKELLDAEKEIIEKELEDERIGRDKALDTIQRAKIDAENELEDEERESIEKVEKEVKKDIKIKHAEEETKKKGFFDFFRRKKEEPKAEEQKDEDEQEEVETQTEEIIDEEKKGTLIGEEEQDKEVIVEESEETTQEEEVFEEETTESEKESEEKKSEDEDQKETNEEEPEQKKGFFAALKEKFTKNVSEEKFEEFFWEIEIAMLENNVSLEVIEKIKLDMKNDIVGKPIAKSDITVKIIKSLKRSIEELFDVPKIDLIKKIEEKNKQKLPFVISFIGVNGSGKTTQLAKVANMLKKKNKTCVIASCDTFRAAAIQQLEQHANNLEIKMIKHDYGADAAAVAFDAIEHAKARGINVVLIDTAGRLHSNSNLMKELEKLMRVSKPDLNIFVGESITGNDCVEQAKKFGEAVRIDGIILTKADVDDKGGAAISISYITGKPIMFFGNGQSYDDLKEFDKKIIMESLELD